MPELPEVQTVVDDLKGDSFVGAQILRAELFWSGCIIKPSAEEFCRQIVGQEVIDVARRGKWIVISLKDFTLLIHLRMSGRIFLGKVIAPSSHERMRLHLADGRVLRFEDQRKFGTVHLLKDPLEKLVGLGVEPLSDSFSVAYLKEVLGAKRKRIKAQLLDQSFIAGLGNIYVDEALWLAKIHPETLCFSLEIDELTLLRQSIQEVLLLGILNKGTSLGEGRANFHGASGNHGQNLVHLAVYQRTKQPCPRCGEPIEKMVSAGRGTHFCPRCQVCH